MRRGPSPKPTAMKIAAGNPGKRPLPENEPEVEPALMDAPEHLSAAAKEEWARVSPKLFAARIVTELDRATLTGYCEAWGNYVAASLQVQKYGAVLLSVQSKSPYISPYLNVMTIALKHMNSFGMEMGMTPASRTKVSTAGGESACGLEKKFKIVG